MSYSIPNIITYAKLSQFLAANDIRVSGYTNGGRIDKRLPMMLYIERKSLEWRYAQNSSDTSLFKVGQYVLALCGKYQFQAQQISGGGGTVVDATAPSVATTFIPKEIQFIVGDVDALVANGGTSITITDANIEESSIEIHVDLGFLAGNVSDRPSYTVAYNSTSAVITLVGQTASTGQLWNIKYRKTQISSASSGSSGSSGIGEPVYYLADGTEGATLQLESLYGITMGFLFRDGRLLQNVSPSTPTNPSQFSFDNNTLDGATPTGTVTFAYALGANELISWDTR